MPLMRSPLSQFQTPAAPRRNSRFFRVRLPFRLPRRADHSAYFGLAKFISPILSAVDANQTKQLLHRCQPTPSISANGTSNAILWAAENANAAVLHAYDAGNLATELYNSNQASNGRDHFGAGNKFITPMIVNGKVYVGTTTGVGVFGLVQ
jgi:hypothetical protein